MFATRFLIAALVAASVAGSVSAAQQSDDPRFAVISLREVEAVPATVLSNAPAIRPDGRFVDPSTTVWLLLARAYPNIKAIDRRVVGLPNWAKSTFYSVSALGPDSLRARGQAENDVQVRRMIRSLLVDRFALRAHIEMREESSAVMTSGGRGILLAPVPPPTPPEVEGNVGLAMGDDGGRIIGKKSTMKGLARAAGTLLEQNVEDRTGDSKYYDWDIRWTNPSPGAATSLGPEGAGLFLSILKDRFGVSLSSSKTSVEYLVIDHVERPVLEK
jgi:uncharacterized protein (TIGR03435 family)